MVKPVNDQYNASLPHHELNRVRLAWEAVGDTLFGGCNALRRVNRIRSLFGARAADEWESIVADVYHASTGRPHPTYGAWECPECGQHHVGLEAAAQCCASDDEEEWS